MNAARSSYYTGRVTPRTMTSALPFKKVFAMIAAAFLVLLTLGAGLSHRSDAAIADLFCGNDLGLNTSWRPVLDFDRAASTRDTDGTAKMSLQDVYGSTLNWTTYNGTNYPKRLNYGSNGPKENILGVSENNAAKDRLASDIQTASESSHQVIPCLGNSIMAMLSGTILGTAGAISNFTAFFAVKAVDPSFICQDPKNTAGDVCINLLAVIAGDGGAGDDGGIIGRLYSGLYLGLVAITFACVGLWAAWTGLAKRKLTAALSGIGIAFLIFGAGVILMNAPLLLAEAPMRIGTSLGGCAVMGINGVNCMSSDSSKSNGDPGSNTECYADDSKEVDVSRSLALISKQLTCQTWESFVFEPWVVGQFGASYNELNSGGAGRTAGPLFQESKGTLDYWKNIKVSLYASDGKITSLCADGNTKYQYSNIAIYQLNLMSDIHACNKSYHRDWSIKTDKQVYSDWVYVIDAMSQAYKNDDLKSMYQMWSGRMGFNRLSVAVMALIASIGGQAVIITTAALAIMYLFIGVLLTVFAPLFFLIGIIPGQGKKIFLGWVEKIVSSILKYFGCILWMEITLELYGAVLSNSNPTLGGTLLFVIIVTMAMWMYRDEFLKMIGKANFGGVQFSNKMEDTMKRMANRTGDHLKARAAGAAAGMIAGDGKHETYDKSKKHRAGDTVNGHRLNAVSAFAMNAAEHNKVRAKNLGHRVKGAHNQSKWAGMQDLKRGNGFVANAARAYDQTMDARRKAAAKKAQQNKEKISAARAQVKEKLLGQGYEEADIERYAGMDPAARAAAIAKDQQAKQADAREKLEDKYETDSSGKTVRTKGLTTLKDEAAARAEEADRLKSTYLEKRHSLNKLGSDNTNDEEAKRLLHHSVAGQDLARAWNNGGHGDASVDDAMAAYRKSHDEAAKGTMTDAEKKLAKQFGDTLDKTKTLNNRDLVESIYMDESGTGILQDKLKVSNVMDGTKQSNDVTIGDAQFNKLTDEGKADYYEKVASNLDYELVDQGGLAKYKQDAADAAAAEQEWQDKLTDARTKEANAAATASQVQAFHNLDTMEAVAQKNVDRIADQNLSFNPKSSFMDQQNKNAEAVQNMFNADGTVNIDSVNNTQYVDEGRSQRGVVRKTAAAVGHGGAAIAGAIGSIETGDGSTVGEHVAEAASTAGHAAAHAAEQVALGVNDALNVGQYTIGTAVTEAGYQLDQARRVAGATVLDTLNDKTNGRIHDGSNFWNDINNAEQAHHDDWTNRTAADSQRVNGTGAAYMDDPTQSFGSKLWEYGRTAAGRRSSDQASAVLGNDWTSGTGSSAPGTGSNGHGTGSRH